MMKWTIQFIWGISILLVVCLSLTPRMEIPYHFSGADKLAHFAAYTWLAMLPFFGFAGRRTALTGALLMALLGIGLECAQCYVPGREFSFFDILANSAGVTIGIVVTGYIKTRRLHFQDLT